MNITLRISISDESQIGYARRTAVTMAQEQGMSETEAGKVAIIVTEAARNQLRYARDGAILLRKLTASPEGAPGIEILALDKGPGLNNIPQSLTDGYTTGSSTGTGLGAIKRQATVFDIFSHPGHGTAILAQCRAEAHPDDTATSSSLLAGAVNLPMHGETACGDTWIAAHTAGLDIYMVCDGLGHGPLAAEASTAAVDAFQRMTKGKDTYIGPGQILEAAHRAMLATRGAAVAVTEIDTQRQTVRFAGIGNIGASLYALNGEKKMASLNGIVGAEMRKVSEFSFPWPNNSLLVMHSDGLLTQWSISRFPGLITRHPSLIAGVLYREFERGRDDVTVLVAAQP